MDMKRCLHKKFYTCSNFATKGLNDCVKIHYNSKRLRESAIQIISAYAGTESTLIHTEVVKAKLAPGDSGVSQSVSIIAFGAAFLYNTGLLIIQHN